ncbi:unnamed protein product [Danaus chrysippus]|uniref:(African queen) hypothetical protein n=1 Tax=Danaus chrysippus TaxID=151541 RepID=A0A8J2VUE8_9NEOP|nr:unnamed protein product [Danaus chrysippus]
MGVHISGRLEALLKYLEKKYPDAYKEFIEVYPSTTAIKQSSPCDMDCSLISSEAESSDFRVRHDAAYLGRRGG